MPAAVVNQDLVQSFAARITANRLAHAFLWIAPQSTGKVATALAVAKLVNCNAPSGQPCGLCESCVKIEHGNHPDIMVMPSDGESIKIEDVRGVLSRIHLRAYAAKVKVFIIPDAHRLTPEAGNALLKTLEEPSAHTLIILTTHVPHKVLGTISSRCQWVRFNPQGINRVKSELMDKGAKPEEADFLAHFSQGWLALGEHMLQEKFYQHKQEVIGSFFVTGLTEECLKEWGEDPKEAVKALNILVSFIRDAMVLQSTGDVALLWHQDALELVRPLSERSPKELTAMLHQVKHIKNQVDENLNAKMAWQILKERLWNPS